MDDDIGIQQHGSSIAARQRPVPADFSLPRGRIDKVPVRVQLAHGFQSLFSTRHHLRRRHRLGTWLLCGGPGLVVNHQHHPCMPGLYPSRQRLGNCDSPVLGNHCIGCQRRHVAKLPHPPSPGNANSLVATRNAKSASIGRQNGLVIGIRNPSSKIQPRRPQLAHGLWKVLRRQLMLPDADDRPAVISKQAVLHAVALFIPFDLCLPPFPAGCRNFCTSGMPVPKVAIHKYRNLPIGKHKVRTNRARRTTHQELQFLPPTPSRRLFHVNAKTAYQETECPEPIFALNQQRPNRF